MLPVITTSTLVALLGVAGSTPAQEVSIVKQGLYDAIPVPERESFRTALDKAISLEKAGKWDELYEMFDHQAPLSKSEFTHRKKRLAKLIEFVPSSVTYIPPSNRWAVHGCAVFDPAPPGRGGGVFAAVDAHHGEGGWRFGGVAIVVTKDEAGGTRSCTPAEPEGAPMIPVRKQR